MIATDMWGLGLDPTRLVGQIRVFKSAPAQLLIRPPLDGSGLHLRVDGRERHVRTEMLIETAVRVPVNRAVRFEVDELGINSRSYLAFARPGRLLEIDYSGANDLADKEILASVRLYDQIRWCLSHHLGGSRVLGHSLVDQIVRDLEQLDRQDAAADVVASCDLYVAYYREFATQSAGASLPDQLAGPTAQLVVESAVETGAAALAAVVTRSPQPGLAEHALSLVPNAIQFAGEAVPAVANSVGEVWTLSRLATEANAAESAVRNRLTAALQARPKLIEMSKSQAP